KPKSLFIVSAANPAFTRSRRLAKSMTMINGISRHAHLAKTRSSAICPLQSNLKATTVATGRTWRRCSDLKWDCLPAVGPDAAFNFAGVGHVQLARLRENYNDCRRPRKGAFLLFCAATGGSWPAAEVSEVAPYFCFLGRTGSSRLLLLSTQM